MNPVLKIALLAVGISLALFFLDKLALAMERRGWIYYRRKKPTTTGLGNAFLNVQSLLEPGTKQIVEVRREKKDQQESGDEPAPEEKHPRRSSSRKRIKKPRPSIKGNVS